MLEIVKNFLEEKIAPDFIILFGSYASGDIHINSDLDIAFYKQNCKYSSNDLFLLSLELEKLVNIPVDLVNLSTASTVFRAEIFANGNVLSFKDEDILDEYHMNAFSMYARLNEERAEIFEEIMRSGTVYGN